jgi:flagellar motor switch/type III secretory pathway protein FliN
MHNESNNKKINNISITKINTIINDYKKFINKANFIWNGQNIKIINDPTLFNDNDDHEYNKVNYKYLGLHTEHGLFYIEHGVQWLQNLTNIYALHKDKATQDWLLRSALERIEPNVFISNIIAISLHSYEDIQNLNATKCLYLQGLCNELIYANINDWLKIFNVQKFITHNSYNIDNILIQKKIILAKQTLKYSQYKKLRQGNIILLNNPQFNIDGYASLNFDSFLMEVLYENDSLFFQSWSQNMTNKNIDDESWDEDELHDMDNNDIDDDIDIDMNEDEDLNEFTDEDTHDYNDDEAQLAQTQEDETRHPFANIPIHLSFSLGQLKMPIAQIMQLGEGAIIDLNKNTSSQVIISANNKEIGIGDIVDIDGKLAVQIIKLYE